MTGKFYVVRDGVRVDGPFPARDYAYLDIHKRQGQSVSWAMKYEGWGIVGETSHLVGRTPDTRERIYVTIKTECLDNRERETVTHERVTGGYRLSITGAVVSRGNVWVSCGQIVDEVRNAVDASTQPGWSQSDRDALVALWERWHLNDMNARCVHQPAEEWPISGPGDKVGALAGCGYRMGTKWLSEPLTSDAWEQINAAQALPTREIPGE